MRVAIAGGGVIGCAIAYYLQKAGADTVLIERGEIGGEASGAAAGMLIPPAAAVPPGPFRDICFASLDLYPSLIDGVQAESGTDVECRADGMLVVAETPAMVHPLQVHARRQQENGINTDWLDREALHRLEPALSPHILGAAYSRDDRNVNPGLLTRALARAAQKHGADIRSGETLTGFLGRGGRLIGVSTNKGEVTADNIVLAAGPWTGVLTPRLGVRLPTPPMRGQMLAYRSTAVRHAIWGDEGYLVPKAGGIVYAGATVEDVGFRKRTTGRALAGLRRMAVGLLPELRRAEIASTWAGLRPGTPDGLPIIGRLPGRENVYVASGHFRNGILLAPITGKLVSQLLLEGRTEMDVSALGPERFR